MWWTNKGASDIWILYNPWPNKSVVFGRGRLSFLVLCISPSQQGVSAEQFFAGQLLLCATLFGARGGGEQQFIWVRMTDGRYV
jgi:hypothetical protein